ncbi:MAG: zinc ribbon domain-containing protein [Pseudomonadota bacterium]
MNKDLDAADAVRACIACFEHIDARATVCPHCGTRQNPWSRFFLRFLTVVGGLVTVLSLVSAGIALAPQAYSFIWPKPQPSIFQMSFDTRDFSTRKAGVFDLYNGGNRDVFATRLIFTPKGDAFARLGPVEISVYEMIAAGAAVEHRIQLISAANPKPRPARALIEDQFVNLSRFLDERRAFDARCFALLPLNASKRRGAPENGRFRYDIASTTLTTVLQYLTVEDDRILAEVEVADFYVEAAVYFSEACVRAMGGPSVFAAAASGQQ